jgi:hypothetical protein
LSTEIKMRVRGRASCRFQLGQRKIHAKRFFKPGKWLSSFQEVPIQSESFACALQGALRAQYYGRRPQVSVYCFCELAV